MSISVFNRLEMAILLRSYLQGGDCFVNFKRLMINKTVSGWYRRLDWRLPNEGKKDQGDCAAYEAMSTALCVCVLCVCVCVCVCVWCVCVCVCVKTELVLTLCGIVML